MRSPSTGLVVHVDADAFFAACELADRRPDPDVPLAVTSSEQGGRASRGGLSAKLRWGQVESR